jgi:hypothetical protein
MDEARSTNVRDVKFIYNVSLENVRGGDHMEVEKG